MKDNPQRRTAIIWGIVTAVAVFAIFAPHIFGMDEFGGGFAISTISFFVAITGIIVVVIYIGRARALDRMFQGENLLAHWTYTPEQWKKYTELEYKTESREKWKLFYLVAGIALFFGIVFFIFDREAGLVVFLVMLGLIALIAFVAWISAWSTYRQNKKYLGEAFIAKDAVYLNRQFHTWKGLGARLESVILAQEKGQQLLAFTYSMPTRTGIQEHTIRVPVPPGQEKSAGKIAEALNANIG